VHTFAKVTRELPARLMLIGDGPDCSEAERLAVSYGIKNRIHFLGKQNSVEDLLSLADLMLMPSEMESFGLAALEAMACSVPSIATRVGGVPELVDDGVTGMLFPVGDTDGMAAAAIDLLTHKNRLAEMSYAARQTAQKLFCSSNVIPLYERFYDGVLARPAM
ncbi:glycosyltransferase, partial [Terriglobus sp. YAF25]